MASTRWTYKRDGGERYPVMPGDLWEVGPHRFLCGDVEGEAFVAFLKGLPLPALVYVDLPYRASDARAYRTKAGVDGDRGRQVIYSRLVRATLEPLRAVPWVYVETGVDGAETVLSVAQAAGFHLARVSSVTYYRKHEAALLAFGDEPGPGLDGVDDEETPGRAIEAHTRLGDLVLDPMVGRGLTAVSAVRAGRRAAGVELSPYRLSVTLSKVADLLGEEPTRASLT